MKKLFVMLLIIGTSTLAFAQTNRVYKGAVIDKNGNLMPGVRIQATKGTEETVTDADGSFTLEAPITLKSVTATYPGMSNTKKSVKNPDEVVIEMNAHQQSQWFAGVVGGYSFEDYEVTHLGVMGGKKGFWGYYAKIMIDITKPKKKYDNDETDCGNGFTITVGGIKSITRNLYIYFGGGYNLGYEKSKDVYSTTVTYYPSSVTNNSTAQPQSYTSYYSYRKWKTKSGIAADFGFMYTVADMINITLGATGRFSFDGKSAPGVLMGASYCF